MRLGAPYIQNPWPTLLWHCGLCWCPLTLRGMFPMGLRAGTQPETLLPLWRGRVSPSPQGSELAMHPRKAEERDRGMQDEHAMALALHHLWPSAHLQKGQLTTFQGTSHPRSSDRPICPLPSSLAAVTSEHIMLGLPLPSKGLQGPRVMRRCPHRQWPSLLLWQETLGQVGRGGHVGHGGRLSAWSLSPTHYPGLLRPVIHSVPRSTSVCKGPGRSSVRPGVP